MRMCSLLCLAWNAATNACTDSRSPRSARAESRRPLPPSASQHRRVHALSLSRAPMPRPRPQAHRAYIPQHASVVPHPQRRTSPAPAEHTASGLLPCAACPPPEERLGPTPHACMCGGLAAGELTAVVLGFRLRNSQRTWGMCWDHPIPGETPPRRPTCPRLRSTLGYAGATRRAGGGSVDPGAGGGTLIETPLGYRRCRPSAPIRGPPDGLRATSSARPPTTST